MLLGNSRRLWDDQSKTDFSSLEFCWFSNLDFVSVSQPCRMGGGPTVMSGKALE